MIIALTDGTRVHADAVVLATAVHDEFPPVDGLADRRGKSVFNCPFCDGREHRDQPVVVVDAAPGADNPGAHILSQPWAWPHTKIHGVMFRQAIRDRDGRATIGQVVRIIVAGPGSLVSKYPVGNTGRTTMALTEVADVPPDLDAILTTRDS